MGSRQGLPAGIFSFQKKQKCLRIKAASQKDWQAKERRLFVNKMSMPLNIYHLL
ncbi:hypothetical protein BRYFOR_06310 [Marvinbryantia formatexigens DSM 14469]|uniref:Uncharacterized protein n=1 Tax=Marvinbryantia formatexigens DSM 14469 TaxID=478749 RepID=C6LCG3_9FIRM|nr:hypothetical protein BRYFOR_06310 [Marvinbryantia formatexigens DSM 14469]